jgi:hypothetical protein
MRRSSSSSLRALAIVALTALSGLTLRPPLYAADAKSAATAAPAAIATDGIALAVVFDTSGSMKELIAANTSGGRDAKFRVAQRAFGLVIDRLDAFTRSPAAKPLSVSVTVFSGRDAHVAIPLAPFDARSLRRWLAHTSFDSSTPLGNAIYLAGQQLLASPAASRHLLVLSDGANNTGRTPEVALQQISVAVERKKTPVFTHIIALDIAPVTFAALKRQGATLIGAADEAQLNTQFDFILEEKILVEAPR